MTGMKMGLNHLAIRTSPGLQETNLPVRENLGIFESNKLIDVSDDEESDEEDLETKAESEQSVDEYEDYEDEDYEDEEEVKVIKLQVSNEDTEDNDSYEEANNLEFDTEDLEGDFCIVEKARCSTLTSLPCNPGIKIFMLQD
jgi:hypothetical protein